MIETPSPNFGDRRNGETVSMLVIHYTGMRSAAESISLYPKKSAPGMQASASGGENGM